jgi:hypothetical protein
MADKLDEIRRKVEELRGRAQEAVRGTGIRLAHDHSHGPGIARTDDQADPAVRGRHRHIEEGKQADLVPHSATGYAKAPAEQQGKVTSLDTERQKAEPKKLTAEQAKQILGDVKVQGREVKEHESRPVAPPEQQRRRAGRER